MSKVVDDWFANYDNPRKELVQAVRRAVLAADKRMDETIKWQAPTFTYKGNLASFYPKSKAHASLMFHNGAQIPGEYPSLEGSGDVSRVMKFMDAADLKKKTPELKRLVKAWCDWKDAG
jgi:hypothetical protein